MASLESLSESKRVANTRVVHTRVVHTTQANALRVVQPTRVKQASPESCRVWELKTVGAAKTKLLPRSPISSASLWKNSFLWMYRYSNSSKFVNRSMLNQPSQTAASIAQASQFFSCKILHFVPHASVTIMEGRRSLAHTCWVSLSL